MGDSYRPNRGGGDAPRRRDFDDYNRHDYKYEFGRDNYDRGNGYNRDANYNGDSGFNFRGAAQDSYRPREPPPQNFTFRAPQQAPHFPQEQPNDRPRRQDQRQNQRGGRRGAPFKPKGPGGQPFRRAAPHERDLLKLAHRETTPEQLPGMNVDHGQKFAEYISDSDDGDSDSDSDGEEEQAEGSSRKRVKTDQDSSLPKWSNPDPYSVTLPPSIAPKKDIVQVIRKSKLDASAQAASANAVKENADFISFDFGEEEKADAELVAGDARNSRAPKRKRGVEMPTTTGDIIDDWMPVPGANATPWHVDDPDFTSNVGMQLHKEIIEFYEHTKPYKNEARLRSELIDRVQNCIRSFKADSRSVEIHSFGSFAAGLYLPTADMDLVAMSQDFQKGGRGTFMQTRTQMHNLGAHLNKQKIVRPGTLLVIAKAKVPIIKFVDRLTGIKVDISFENDSGIIANKTFKAWKEEFPEMPVLVMIIKQFLAMRGLNDNATKGLGGFTTICLVVSMLQMLPEELRKNAEPQSRFANLLMHFLDLYGNKFDVQTHGITMNPPGYFPKRTAASTAKINMTGLTIIDPNRSNNDIAGGSKRVLDAFHSFSMAHAVLQRRAEQITNGNIDPSSSILGEILGGNYTSFEQARDHLWRVDRELGHPSGHSPTRDNYSSAPPPPQQLQQSQSTNFPRNNPPGRDNYSSAFPPQQHSQFQPVNYSRAPPPPPPATAYPTHQQPTSYYGHPPPPPPPSYSNYGQPPPPGMPAHYAQQMRPPQSILPPPHHSLPQQPQWQQMAPQGASFSNGDQPVKPNTGSKQSNRRQKKKDKKQAQAQQAGTTGSATVPKKKKKNKNKKNKGAGNA